MRTFCHQEIFYFNTLNVKCFKIEYFDTHETGLKNCYLAIRKNSTEKLPSELDFVDSVFAVPSHFARQGRNFYLKPHQHLLTGSNKMKQVLPVFPRFLTNRVSFVAARNFSFVLWIIRIHCGSGELNFRQIQFPSLA